jgi:hypothetical protein
MNNPSVLGFLGWLRKPLKDLGIAELRALSWVFLVCMGPAFLALMAVGAYLLCYTGHLVLSLWLLGLALLVFQVLSFAGISVRSYMIEIRLKDLDKKVECKRQTKTGENGVDEDQG